MPPLPLATSPFTSAHAIARCIACLGFAAFAAACGGGDDSSGGADAGATGADAQVTADAAPQSCINLEPAYGNVGSVTGTALVRPVDDLVPDGAKYLSLQIALNQDTTPDVLFIELWDGDSPFTGGIATGDYSLIGDQADLIQCGACVFIAADHVAGQPIDFHMAASGTLTLDMVDATPTTGRIAGSLSNVVLRQVTVDQSGQMTVLDGCRPTLDAVAFDFSIAVPSE